jgi:hypothetical protein
MQAFHGSLFQRGSWMADDGRELQKTQSRDNGHKPKHCRHEPGQEIGAGAKLARMQSNAGEQNRERKIQNHVKEFPATRRNFAFTATAASSHRSILIF